MNTHISKSDSLPQTGEISSLHVLKAFCAFVVVRCHCPFLLDWIHLPGLSVDIFFLITGYFLYNQETTIVQVRIGKSIKKLIPLIIALNIIYYPLGHVSGSLQESYVAYFRWIILGYPSFSNGHIWYLSAVLYGLLSLGLFIKLFGNKYIPLLFPLLLVGLVAFSDYRYFIDGVTESALVFNFLTRGLPFLAIGYYIKMNETKLLQRGWWVLTYLALILVGMIETLIMRYITNGQASGGLVGLILIPVLFIVFLSYKDFGKGSILVTIGKEYSGNIYYFHMMVIAGFRLLATKFPLIQYLYDQGAAVIVFFISLGIAYCINKIQKRIGYTLFP